MQGKKISSDQRQLSSDALVNLAEHKFEFLPTGEELETIRGFLDLIALDKMRFVGKISRVGKSDLHLTGKLGVSVTQPCSVTLEPVKTRIETEVSRQFLTKMPEPDGETVVEMELDESIDHMPETIDLLEIAQETVSLNLPLFPRSPSAEPENMVFGPPGTAPMTDDDAKPFAGLASLKDKMKG